MGKSCSSCGSKDYQVIMPVSKRRNHYIVKCNKCGNMYVKEIKE